MHAGVSLLFPFGARPSANGIVGLLEPAEAGIPARVSHHQEGEEGWVEILANGLTFDLRGLSPADPAGLQDAPHAYGFEDGAPARMLEPVELVPSRHIAAGARSQPVMRALAGLAANLALHLPTQAVIWHPAQTMMDPRYFSRLVFNWLSGGAFPALGLTALVPAKDGSVASKGLAHFTGQEMELEGREGEAQADTVKLAIRLVDHLVRHGPLDAPCSIDGGKETLLAEPSRVGKRVWVWRTEA